MKIVYLIRHSEAIDKENLNFLDNLSHQEKNEKQILSVLGEKKAQRVMLEQYKLPNTSLIIIT